METTKVADQTRIERPTPGQDGQTKTTGETLLDFLAVITNWRRFIVWFVLTATLGTMVVALLSPKWYKSTASVFPAEQTELFPGLEGVSSLVRSFSGGGGGGILGDNEELDRYLAILKSGRVLGAVIEKFDLVHVYDIISYPAENTTKELLSNTEFVVEDEGNLTIAVYDKDPVRASSMANYFVELLNKANSEIKAQNARGNRTFIEQRHLKNLEDLRGAEDSLKAFQLRYGVVALPEQLEASIKAVAEVYGTLVSKEVELGVAKKSFSPEHPAVQRAQLEVNELRKKLRELNRGSTSTSGEMKILVPFQQAPQLGADYLRLYRNVEIEYKILQFITPLYEQAKVEEQRNTPSVVVLDYGGVPERKAKPKVVLYTLLAFVISTTFSLFIIFTKEGILKLKQTNPDRYNSIVSAIRSDFSALKWKRNAKK